MLHFVSKADLNVTIKAMLAQLELCFTITDILGDIFWGCYFFFFLEQDYIYVTFCSFGDWHFSLNLR